MEQAQLFILLIMRENLFAQKRKILMREISRELRLKRTTKYAYELKEHMQM